MRQRDTPLTMAAPSRQPQPVVGPGVNCIARFVFSLWGIAQLRKLQQRRLLDSQTGLASIRELSWRDFERLLAEAFRRRGYQVEETGPGPDGGVDLILRRGDQVTLVQAKQWNTFRVGVKIVRELYGVQKAQGATTAIVVTSGRFTESEVPPIGWTGGGVI